MMDKLGIKQPSMLEILSNLVTGRIENGSSYFDNMDPDQQEEFKRFYKNMSGKKLLNIQSFSQKHPELYAKLEGFTK